MGVVNTFRFSMDFLGFCLKNNSYCKINSCKIEAIFRSYYVNVMSEPFPCKLSDNMPLSWFYSKATCKTRTFPY